MIEIWTRRGGALDTHVTYATTLSEARLVAGELGLNLRLPVFLLPPLKNPAACHANGVYVVQRGDEDDELERIA